MVVVLCVICMFFYYIHYTYYKDTRLGLRVTLGYKPRE